MTVFLPNLWGDALAKIFRRTLVDQTMFGLFWEPTPVHYRLCFDEIGDGGDTDRDIPEWRDRQWTIFL